VGDDVLHPGSPPEEQLVQANGAGGGNGLPGRMRDGSVLISLTSHQADGLLHFRGYVGVVIFKGPHVERLNAWVSGLRTSPRWGRLVSRHITLVTYTGRRSGRTFTIPVGYKRSGGIVTIGVRFPDAKTWWRNFHDPGGPITVELDGTGRTGHAVAERDERGRVTVRIDLRESRAA
jgi:hypothetical protein